jgi:NitT/TauT family transport system ATP-binding protein
MLAHEQNVQFKWLRGARRRCGMATAAKPGAHLSVSGVSHRYRRAPGFALANVSFDIEPCEAVALVGRSGCGKSTLLHLMAGLMSPTAGDVYIDGLAVMRPSPRWVVMFQQPHLYPWMTVAQNIGLGLKFAGRRNEIPQRVAELLDLVELQGFGDRNVQDLSGGQQQRVALARSLAVRPEILFLDEPFSALDAVTRRALQRDVRRIAHDLGITLVIVTHDIAEAVAMADRAFVMSADPGRISAVVPIRLDAGERDRRGPAAQAIQAQLHAAFERASGRAVQPANGEAAPLRLVAGASR